MQFEITYLPRGCLESTNKIGNVGESSYYRIEFQFDKYQQAEKDEKKALHTREADSIALMIFFTFLVAVK